MFFIIHRAFNSVVLWKCVISLTFIEGWQGFHFLWCAIFMCRVSTYNLLLTVIIDVLVKEFINLRTHLLVVPKQRRKSMSTRIWRHLLNNSLWVIELVHYEFLLLPASYWQHLVLVLIISLTQLVVVLFLIMMRNHLPYVVWWQTNRTEGKGIIRRMFWQLLLHRSLMLITLIAWEIVQSLIRIWCKLWYAIYINRRINLFCWVAVNHLGFTKYIAKFSERKWPIMRNI